MVISGLAFCWLRAPRRPFSVLCLRPGLPKVALGSPACSAVSVTSLSGLEKRPGEKGKARLSLWLCSPWTCRPAVHWAVSDPQVWLCLKGDGVRAPAGTRALTLPATPEGIALGDLCPGSLSESSSLPGAAPTGQALGASGPSSLTVPLLVSS